MQYVLLKNPSQEPSQKSRQDLVVLELVYDKFQIEDSLQKV